MYRAARLGCDPPLCQAVRYFSGPPVSLAVGLFLKLSFFLGINKNGRIVTEGKHFINHVNYALYKMIFLFHISLFILTLPYTIVQIRPQCCEL